MIGKLFRAHGDFCASHPWEVIVALLTLTACMLTVDKIPNQNDGSTSSSSTSSSASWSSSRHRPCQGWTESCEGLEAEYNAADVILMTIVRCSAVLYCYYQFCSLHKLGSKYILGITGLFTVFSSFIFTTSIIRFFESDVSDLKDALFFLFLLIDLSNSGVLAQLALTGSNQAEVTRNIARGMELLGPKITLDTIVETLVIGVGTLSGARRLEILCSYAVMSVIVNYIVFMTFYPACLSLILDLSRYGMDIAKVKAKAKESILVKALSEEEQKMNPVVQRVKVIMSTGLMIVHVYSRVFFSEKEYSNKVAVVTSLSSPQLQQTHHHMNYNRTESAELSKYIIKWLTMSADQIVILILLIALVVKFIFFENRNEIHLQLSTEASNLNAIQQKTESISIINQQHHQSQHCAQLSPMVLPLRGQEIQKKPLYVIEENPLVNKCTQTDHKENLNNELVDECDYVRNKQHSEIIEHKKPLPPRSLKECLDILESETGAAELTDDEITMIVKFGNGKCPLYKIESVIKDPQRGVKIRRKIICDDANVPYEKLNELPYKHYDYTKVMNACCENVLGYIQVPVGYAGPLLLDGKRYFVPMATTEGALVASTNRGCKALSVHGVSSYVEDVGMTRAPCVKFPSVYRAAEAKKWINQEENYRKIKIEFDSTSRFGRLKELLVAMDGPQLYIRFVALTGDAMGMNMVSKGAEMALKCIKKEFPDMHVISLSGNFCSDKKPAAINWIKGRGKRVVTECIIPAATLKQILKTDAKTLVECNKMKNMSGSAMAGSIGGNNAHAANMVTAVFIATGQDPAQNVTSSNCSTGMECWGENNEDLYMTCTMPSLEVGTVGGGTGLPGQSACLEMLGIRGANKIQPGENAKKLAQIICATVMAGELSLMAALVNSDLVKSHMRHNRSSVAATSAALSLFKNMATTLPVTNNSSSNTYSSNNSTSSNSNS